MAVGHEISHSNCKGSPTLGKTLTFRWVRLLPLLAYGFFFWRTVYGMRNAWVHTLDWIVVLVLLVVWIGVGWLRGRRWPITPLNWPIVVGLLWAAVNVLIVAQPRMGLFHMWELFTLALLFWLLTDLIRSGWERALWQAFYLIAGVVSLLSAVEFLSWYFGLPPLSSSHTNWFSVGGWKHPIPPTMYRLGLALANPTALSAFMALLVPPALGILLSSRRRDTRIGMGLWILSAVLVALLTFSRGGLVALGVSLTFFTIGASYSSWVGDRWSRRNTVLLRTLGVVAALCFVGLVILVSGGFGHAGADAVRFDLWRSAVVMIRDHPLTGVGLGQFGSALRAIRDPHLATDYLRTAHSLYLNAAAEVGVPGLLFLFWLGLAAVGAGWVRWRAILSTDPEWWRMLGIGAALLGWAFQSMFDNFTEPAILLTVVFLLSKLVTRPGRPGAFDGNRLRWRWVVALGVLFAGIPLLMIDSLAFLSFQRSVAEVNRADIGAAIHWAEKARRIDPWMPMYDCHSGFLYGLLANDGEQGALARADAAYESCEGAVDVPGWTDRLNHGVLQWQSGNTQEAWQSFNEAVTYEPGHTILWLNRGLLAENLGYDGDAIESYSSVLRLNPYLAASPFWEEGPRAEMWPDILQKGAESAAASGDGTPYWRWRVQLAANNCSTVADEMEVWLTSYPHDYEAGLLLSECHLSQGRPWEALQWIEESSADTRVTAARQSLRARANLALDRLEQAEQDIEEWLFLSRGSDAVHMGLAELAEQRGHLAAAEQAYSLALCPTVIRHAFDVVLYDRAGWPVTLPQAASIGTRHDHTLALRYGSLLESHGRFDEARKLYALTLARDPYLSDIRLRLDALP